MAKALSAMSAGLTPASFLKCAASSGGCGTWRLRIFARLQEEKDVLAAEVGHELLVVGREREPALT